MRICFDSAKNARNVRTRDLSFERARELEFETALTLIDRRHDYGETRYIAIGYLDARLHVLCYTRVAGGIRVISFRKANPRKVRRYETQ